MIINLNVKVKAGPRTPLEVEAYGTAVNPKTIRFANGRVVTERQIAEWIVNNLHASLEAIEESGGNNA